MNDEETRLMADDLMRLESISDARIHPDGNLIAYTVSANVSKPKTARVPSRIWLTGTDFTQRAITADGTFAGMPRWSPDGRMLAFLASRDKDGKEQLHLLDDCWGEARQLTDCASGVASYEWDASGETLTLLIADPPPDDEKAEHDAGRDWVEYERNHRFTRLWRCDATTGKLARLSNDDLQVYEFAWSPVANELVAIVADEPYNWAWYRARLARLDGETGRFTTIREARKQITFPAWSPNGQTIAFIACTFSDQGMTGGDVVTIGRDGSGERNITEEHPRSYLYAEWEPAGDELLVAAIEDGESVVGRLTLAGEFTPFWRERASILRWGGLPFTRARTADGERIALVIGTPEAPAEVHTLERGAARLAPRRLSTTHTGISGKRRGATETLHWPSFDGTTIQGLLIHPPGWTPGTRLPMIVLVHGGPTSLWSYDFPGARSMGWVQLLAAEGYAVFLPNPRGSMGFGTRFAEANLRDMGGGDWADVMAGIDWCIEHGIADGERLGIDGWSYGGYLTAWGVTQTNRFKAAVAGASITNWISFHGVSTIPDFDAVFYASDPFDWDGCYGQYSPMAHVRRVTTPTLFLHGERDPICPVGQAHEMWRALKELHVPSELVVYPREGHGIREREHARDVLTRAVEWWKRWV